jgi:class 3 adenylate cyclase/tetratricopeptide (TPR) repeat protein
MVLVDVSGFTSMSERLARRGRIGAEEVTEIIGDLFGRLLGEAYRQGGDLLKFGGDALLLFFEGSGHALRAVSAAQAMRGELRKTGTFETSAGRVTLRMSVGAHSGTFSFFVVGDSHRELIVAGPAATETVRMESAAKAGQILLSPEAAGRIHSSLRGRVDGPGVLLRSIPVSSGSWEGPGLDTASAHNLAYYLPAALCEGINSGSLQPEHRSATVGFIQFLEFDRLIEMEGPDVAAESLDELVTEVQRAVDDRGITFLGSDISADGGKLILTGGVPKARGNDEELMLLALRQIVSTRLSLPIRVGVNRGQVFSGEVGPEFRRTYTVMGDTVNLAARLMAKAEPGQILSTSEVLEGSRTLFETTPLEPFLVKGKKHPVHAFSVGEPSGSRSSIAEAGLPMIGRDEELTVLNSAWDSVLSGRGRMVELVAEPGMGKTRLLDEFLGNLKEVRIVKAECRLYQSATPYFPMATLLRSALGLPEGIGEELAADLKRVVMGSAPELEPWLALLGAPLDIELPESEEVRQLDDEFKRDKLEEAVEDLLASVLTEPAVLTIDDTHWMDEASAKLLEHVTGSLDARPWLVIVSRRPGNDGFITPELETVDRVELRVLDAEQAASLIDAATSDRLLPQDQVRSLAARAEGNPLFLIELLDALKRGEDVATLPHSVEGMIGARIDRLPLEDLTTLRQLSVLGSGFYSIHANAVLEPAQSRDLEATLARLEGFLLTEERGWVLFRHALIRDAAYQGLPYRTRQRLHRQVADSILSETGKNPKQQADLLSLHFYEAASWWEAWTYSRMAGDAARDAYANVEAVKLYSRALTAARRVGGVDVDDKVLVLTELAEVAEQAGLFDQSLEALREAIRHTREEPVTQAALRLRRARAHLRHGAYPQALAETARGLRLTRSVQGLDASRVQAKLLALRGAIRMQQGRPGEALSCAYDAVGLAKETEEMDALARAYQVLDGANEMLGRHDDVAYADEAWSIYEALGDLQGCAHVANDRGVANYFSGRWDDAIRSFGTARDMFLKAGNETQAAMAAANMGEVLVAQDRLSEAEPLLTEAVRMLRAHDHLDLAINAEAQLARLQIGSGDADGGVALLTNLYAEATVAGDWSIALQIALHLAGAMADGGQPEKALELLEAMERSAAEDLEVFAAARSRVRALVMLALGRSSEAERLVAEGLEAAREQGLIYDESQLLLLLSEIRGGGGDPEPALLEQAQGLLQQLGIRAAVAV